MPNFNITLWQAPGRRGIGDNARGFIKAVTIKPGDTAALAAAVEFDNCPGLYKGGYRTGDNFQKANCILADIDNTHSDDPAEWRDHNHVIAAMPGVAFYWYPSRNNMKEKDGRSPRPKEHYIFPIDETTEADEYTGYMKWLIEAFPKLHFDEIVKSAAQLNFGTEKPQVSYIPGELSINKFMEQLATEKWEKQVRTVQVPKFADVIPIGQRNKTLSRFAAAVLKKYGNEDGKAYAAFREKTVTCEQPLPDSELSTIWRSAEGNYTRNTSKQPGYIPPAEYVAADFSKSLEPSDYTDIGQANVIAGVYGNKLKFTKATNWLTYSGKVWREDEIKAQGLAQDLTERQLKEARGRVRNAQNALNKATEVGDEGEIIEAKKRLSREEAFRAYVLSERKTAKVSAALTEARPKLQIAVSDLDADGYLLNTPGGTVDLRTGEMRPHNPADYCTKITTVAPSTEGAELFAEFLQRVTCNDSDLERYLQEVAGMFTVGEVLRENLIIAYGEGGNGKSTLFNLLARIMGDYAGALSAETLTVNCRKNKSPEYAELRGKRIIIAAELEEGMRLDTSTVKKLCSTDPILAEKKYKDPFTFTPSHTVVLYTNHLPKVGTTDKGTWDRLVTIPFNANFRGMKGEVLNYADYLFNHAGGAVLAWIIEGARRFIANNYKIEMPECVKAAIGAYRANNDWLDNFLAEECEIDSGYSQKSGELYQRYKTYCDSTGDYRRSLADFKTALTTAGYETRKTRLGAFIYGLRVKSEFAEVDEPTPWG